MALGCGNRASRNGLVATEKLPVTANSRNILLFQEEPKSGVQSEIYGLIEAFAIILCSSVKRRTGTEVCRLHLHVFALTIVNSVCTFKLRNHILV